MFEFSCTNTITSSTLYTGTNGEQTVYTWLANSTVGSIQNMDISPLLRYLVDTGLLAGDLYLGTVQFGCETLYSGSKQMNFSVKSYSADIVSSQTVGDSSYPTKTLLKATTIAERSVSSAPTLREATSGPWALLFPVTLAFWALAGM